MQKLLDTLRSSLPELTFTPGEKFYWSPETREVMYREQETGNKEHAWALLHETGHALLGHASYKTDVELLKMEIAAWEKARELGQRFDIMIDENHVQDCLDTYRDWLHARALCPTCKTRCLQNNSGHSYRCHNCHTSWKVTPSRFCRPYRSVQNGEPVVVFPAQASATTSLRS
ncbi:MAG: hypothetical protein ACREGB_04025 [Candidatus Saccharimonadales bacterium]